LYSRRDNPRLGNKLLIRRFKANRARIGKAGFLLSLFALFGVGGVVAANNISINSAAPLSLSAGYTFATSCDESVTLNAITAIDAASGQLYVATIALSNIDQTPITGCGYKNAEVALRINGQMTYASWTIIPSTTSDTFSFTGATTSTNNKYAATLLTPFQADGLTNVAVRTFGSGYQIGDIGPGGGRVFYVSTTGFNCGLNYSATGSPYGTKCYYLEAASTTGTSAWTDIGRSFSAASNISTAVTGADGYDIGYGYQNSLDIAAQAGNTAADSAAVAVFAYRGPNNLSDWYLPSRTELSQMCKWQRGFTGTNLTNLNILCNAVSGTVNSGVGAAGFLDSNSYWSSTEQTSANALDVRMGNGTYGGGGKGSTYWVRPIRAF